MVVAMRNLRCWLFGHEWVPTTVAEIGDLKIQTRVATCPRCGMTCGFVVDDRDSDEVNDE